MLLHPLDAVLSSQSKVRLLRALLAQEDALSAREATRLAAVPLAPGLRALADLVALGVLRCTKLRTQHLYTVNRDDPLVVHGLLPLFAAEQARVRAVFASLREGLAEELTAKAVRTLSVCGSAARGEDRPGSTLDLLVVTGSADDLPQVEAKLARLAGEMERRFGTRLSPTLLSQEQFHERCAAGDPAVLAMLYEGRVVA
jgi:predicted nucleotidyltransferase